MARRCPILLTAVICARDCAVCREEHEERCALVADGCKLDRPTAEAEARCQLAERLPGQREMSICISWPGG